MIAKSDTYIEKAASTVYKLTQEEKIRQQCEAREDYRRRTEAREKKLADALSKNQQLESELKQARADIEQLKLELEYMHKKRKE